MGNNLSVMIKPASSKCNASCEYCFYRDEVAMRKVKDYGNTTVALADIMIKKMLSFVGNGHLSIVFQGGEPTLAGYSFFEHFFQSLNTKNVSGAKISLSLQTNGLLVDKRWAKLFKKYNVLVGLSLDGDRKACYARVAHGKEMFASILGCASILKKEGVDFCVLSVIHKGNAMRTKEIYDDLTRRGFRNLQFIPYLGDNPEFILSSKDYADFLINVYALYAKDFHSPTPTRIRQFDNYLMLLRLGHAEQCGMNGKCEESLTFEGDGTAYPCDFYCTDDYALGNINESSIAELLASPVATSFRSESYLRDDCHACPYFTVCRGGCKRYMQDKSFCEAYKIFFAHSFK